MSAIFKEPAKVSRNRQKWRGEDKNFEGKCVNVEMWKCGNVKILKVGF